MKFAIAFIVCTNVLLALAKDEQLPEFKKEILDSELEDTIKNCSPALYEITSVDDLKLLVEDLECVFWGGFVPPSIPLGSVAADTLEVKGSEPLGEFLGMLWQGHVFSETVCERTTKYFDQATLPFGIRPSVGKISLEVLPVQLAEGEHNDGSASMQIDYDMDFKLECPMEITDPGFVEGLLHGVFAPYAPINPPGAGIYFDSLRVVGRDAETNRVILLEKFYTNSEEGYVSVGFNALRSTDSTLNSLVPATIILNQNTTFDYVQKSGLEIFKIMWGGVPGEIMSLPVSHDLKKKV